MEALLKTKRPQEHYVPKSVQDLHAMALQAACAHTAETFVSEIFSSLEPDRVRAEAILDIAMKRPDQPSIQLRSFQDLKALDTGAARRLVTHILQEPLDEDRDHLRARALATLVELPDITREEAILIGEGLRCRFRNVAHAVKQAINSLTRSQLSTLGDAVEQVQGVAASKVVPLAALIREAYPTAQSRSVVEEFADDRTAEEPSFPRELRNVSMPVASRIRPSAIVKTVARPQPRPVAQEAETPGIGSVITAAEPQVDTRTPQALTVEPLSLPSRPIVSITSASLNGLRDPKLLDKTWQELLFERDRQKDPRKLCACIAEMVARFGAELSRDAASSALIYVVSHPDPELKRMGEVLVDLLFRAR